MNHLDALILRRPLVAYLARTVGAAVINSNNLKAVEVLLQQAFQTLPDVLFLVIDGYDD